jgi:hypothetical protein
MVTKALERLYNDRPLRNLGPLVELKKRKKQTLAIRKARQQRRFVPNLSWSRLRN